MVNQTNNGEDLFTDHSDFPQIMVISSILATFSIVGTTGNAFVLYVFSRKKDKNTSTIFIITLAATDFLTCLFVIPFTIVVEFMSKKVGNDVVCKMYTFLITSNVPFSAFIMVAIAFDRYFCICRPWLKVLDIKIAKRVIASLLLFAITLGLITCVAHGVYHHKDMVISKGNVRDLSGNISGFANQSETKNDSGIDSSINTFQTKLGVGDTATLQLSEYVNSSVLVFTGFCYPNELILAKDMRKIYQKFYASLFLIAFITVFILYALIYKSLLTRRSKKLRTSMSHRPLKSRRSTLLTNVLNRRSEMPTKSTIIMDVENLNNQQCDVMQNNSDIMAKNRQIWDNLNSDTAIDNSLKTDTICTDVVNKDSSGRVTELDNHKTSNCTTINYIKPYTNKKYQRKSYGKSLKNNNALNHEANDELKPLNQRVSIEAETSVNHNIQENTQMTTVAIYRQDTRKSVREKHMIANIKTAGILFIVTVVFILAFLPAWLMATQLIPANMVVFYMYFSYNVANPVIYAFFNKTFQKEVQQVLKCNSYTI